MNQYLFFFYSVVKTSYWQATKINDANPQNNTRQYRDNHLNSIIYKIRITECLHLQVSKVLYKDEGIDEFISSYASYGKIKREGSLKNMKGLNDEFLLQLYHNKVYLYWMNLVNMR